MESEALIAYNVRTSHIASMDCRASMLPWPLGRQSTVSYVGSWDYRCTSRWAAVMLFSEPSALAAFIIPPICLQNASNAL
jgi:hypothetical protein